MLEVPYSYYSKAERWNMLKCSGKKIIDWVISREVLNRNALNDYLIKSNPKWGETVCIYLDRWWYSLFSCESMSVYNRLIHINDMNKKWSGFRRPACWKSRDFLTNFEINFHYFVNQRHKLVITYDKTSLIRGNSSIGTILNQVLFKYKKGQTTIET